MAIWKGIRRVWHDLCNCISFEVGNSCKEVFGMILGMVINDFVSFFQTFSHTANLLRQESILELVSL